MKNIFCNEEGADLVEFALAASATFSVLFMLFYLCMALFSYNYTTQVARNATRYAIVRGSSCIGFSDCGIDATGVSNYVSTHGLGGMTAQTTWYQAGYDSNGHTIWTACAGKCNDPGNAVAVQVTYPLVLNVPFVPKRTLSISSTSQLVISQ